jgi:hypothetical protein
VLDVVLETYGAIIEAGLLPYVALILVVGSFSIYLSRVLNGLILRSRPLLTEGLVLTGFLLAIVSLFQSPGIVGGAAAVLTILVGGLVGYLFSQGPLPKRINVKVGEPAPGFTLDDWDGNSFSLTAGEGDPLLLKFYRGHW